MVSKTQLPPFVRDFAKPLGSRLLEPRRYIQVVTGARQVGKTTLVRQVLSGLDLPHRFASADEPTLRDATWMQAQWDATREMARASDVPAVLALDEIQKIPGWSETVKRLWDEDTASGVQLHVVLLGSAPLLVQAGLVESLAGRFEQTHLPHWSFAEMRPAFGFSIDQFMFFGGYPGAAPLANDADRWRRYVLDSLVETTISRDVLLMRRVDKPALLRRLFELGCRYSGRILSYNKMLGQLQDAGNTTTLAHYLDLLSGVGMLTGIPKYAGETVRQRGSSPKLQVLNTALMTAQAGLTPNDVNNEPEFLGHLTESAVGAHLANATAMGQCELFYWRDRNREVDFVVRAGRSLTAIEVKSSRNRGAHPGLAAFAETFSPDRILLVGGDGIALEDFLSQPVAHWLAS